MKDGGPAFPYSYEEIAPVPDDGKLHHQQKYTVVRSGMSLRDYFAAAAMGQMMASDLRKDSWANVAAVAADAYKMADAMLRERDK